VLGHEHEVAHGVVLSSGPFGLLQKGEIGWVRRPFKGDGGRRSVKKEMGEGPTWVQPGGGGGVGGGGWSDRGTTGEEMR
jgi:hypothetical protein